MPKDAAERWLEAQRNPDGSWGYLPGQAGRAEPTVLCAAVGLQPPLGWLEEAELGFAELLLPVALSRHPDARALCEVTAERLLELAGVPNENGPEIEHDATLIGWPWYEGTSSWVEPTSYAILSLRRWGHGGHARVAEALAMLRNRQCRDGGWNYGNTRVFDEWLESDLPPTGWACLALGADPVVERAIARLEAVLERPSTMNLALAILARVARGLPVDLYHERLAARQLPDGSFMQRIDTTALGALALGAAEEGSHVFAQPA